MATLSRAHLIDTIFPTAFAHFMSLCHILVILKIFQTFKFYYIVFVMVISDLWCYYWERLWLTEDRWWSALFSNEVIFNWGVYTFICLLSFGRTESSLLYSGFLWVWQVGATPPCSVQASRCAGFPCGRAQVLGSQASGAAVWGLRSCGSRVPECRLRSCKAWA